MNVLLTGTNFLNKGAELMMDAVLDELHSWPEVEAVAMPLEAGSFAERSASGAHHLIGRKVDRLPAVEAVIAGVGNVIPRRIASIRGLVRARDVRLVVDASGYSYSDRSGPLPARRSARTYARYASSGATVVLLPQAFGPFERDEVREAFRAMLATTSLAFARDPESLGYARGVGDGRARLAVAPDFTIPTLGTPTDAIGRYRGRACLVPNVRMLRDTDPETASWYLALLGAVADGLSSHGLEPFVLIHEPRDAVIVDDLRARASTVAEVVTDPDPRVLKAIIGSASVAVGSRFHALVSALSSGVPAVGIGWSHKYEALFADFGVPELCLRNGTPADEVVRLAADLASPGGSAPIRAVLAARTTALTGAVAEMWAAVRLEADL